LVGSGGSEITRGDTGLKCGTFGASRLNLDPSGSKNRRFDYRWPVLKEEV
jgi:hypothetical protein